MRAFVSLLSFVSLIGCANDVVTDVARADLDVDTVVDNQAVTVPADWGSERLYLGHDEATYVDRTKGAGLFHFDLIAGAVVDVAVFHEDGRRRAGLRAYRLSEDGRLRFVGEVAGRGGALARLNSRQGGTIVLEVFGTFPARRGSILTVRAECARSDGGRCTEARQPGELCGTRGAGPCDEGLYCDFPVDTMCGAYDAGGSCRVPVDVCPAAIGPQVCGCDGVTYNSACDASMAGVALRTSEPCVIEEPVCDPAVYNLVKDDGTAPILGSMAGVWLFHGTTEAADVEGVLRLGADGWFTYDQVHNPLCLRGDPPCRVASRVFSMHGTWTESLSGVQLTPEDPENAPDLLAQAFSIVANCEGDARLRTTEIGVERDFILDRCADVICGEGESCVLEPVMCIRAPCPPMPTCVAQ